MISFQIKHWVAFGLPYLLIELFYIGMPVVLTDGRSLAQCTVTWLPNFLGWVDHHIFFALRVELRYDVQTKIKVDFMQQTTERNSIKTEQYCRKQVWDYVEIPIVWPSHPLSG